MFKFLKGKEKQAILDLPLPPPMPNNNQAERLDAPVPYDFEKFDAQDRPSLADEQDLEQIKLAIEQAVEQPVKPTQSAMPMQKPQPSPPPLPSQKNIGVPPIDRFDLSFEVDQQPEQVDSFPEQEEPLDEDLPDFKPEELVAEQKTQPTSGYTLQTLPNAESFTMKQAINVYIDIRDYGKIFREMKHINIFTKRTFNTVLKIKDISGNQNKLYQKFYDDLGMMNERLTMIDTIMFENG